MFVGQGGDEFLVLRPKTELKGGLLLAEKLRAALKNLRVSIGKGRFWNSSMSIGVASPDKSMYSTEDLLKISDEKI